LNTAARIAEKAQGRGSRRSSLSAGGNWQTRFAAVTRWTWRGKLKRGASRAGMLSWFQQAAKESKLVRASKSLPIEQLLKVSEVAGPDELKELRPILMRRLSNLGRSHDPDEAADLAVRIRNILASKTVATAVRDSENALRKVLGTRVAGHTQGIR